MTADVLKPEDPNLLTQTYTVANPTPWTLFGQKENTLASWTSMDTGQAM